MFLMFRHILDHVLVFAIVKIRLDNTGDGPSTKLLLLNRGKYIYGR